MNRATFMSSDWYHYFAITIILSLLANCLPLPDDQAKQENSTITTKAFSTSGEEGKYFQGDIRLRSNANKANLNVQKRSTVQNNSTINNSTNNSTNQSVTTTNDIGGGLWPDGIVYYKYDTNLTTNLGIFMETFRQAMNKWELATCLKFKPAQENHTAYLNFTDKEGCSSFIGRIGTMQEVSLTPSCLKIGHAVHEIGHAIGLWHEHTRTDRDDYIEVVEKNINPEYLHNFEKYPHPEVPDVGYDLQSIMHYPTNAFSIDKRTKETIRIKYNPLPSCIGKVGQRDYISYKDALRVNKMYRCTEKLNKNNTNPCPLPKPTTTTISPSTTTVSASIIPTPTPTCTVQKAVKSGSYVSLPFSTSALSGIGCFSDCEKRSCLSTQTGWQRYYDGCEEMYFVIYLASNKKNRYIRTGDTVAFKSLKRTDHWIDCSRGNCTLTKCPDNPKTGKITNFTKQICTQHKFKIVSLGTTKRIRTTDSFYLQSLESEKYLNCVGKRCQMITEGSDCGDSESGSSGDLCNRQHFGIEKLVQTCLT